MHVDIQPFAEYAVAPYVGAWIETLTIVVTCSKKLSHPTWVRGLKHTYQDIANFAAKVAPYVGAWIETIIIRSIKFVKLVAPYVGAWIETSTSLLALVRMAGRTLRGCVD